MKNVLIVYFLFISYTMCFSQPDISIGMAIDEVKKNYPDMKETKYQGTITLERYENLHGLNGYWGYRFEHDKLNWFFFHKYIDKINEENFKKCFTSTKNIISDCIKQYGSPDTVITGDTTFTDPLVKRHWGYDVIEARWKNHRGMKIKVEFTFMGGKGEYHFLVNINYFDKNYLYYD